MNCKDDLEPGDFRYSLDHEVLSLGYRKHVKKSQNKHYHMSYELLLVLSGDRRMFAGSKTYSMDKASLLLIPPEVLHKDIGHNNGSEIYSINYKAGPEIVELIGQNIINMKLTLSDFSQITSLIGKMIIEFQNKELGYAINLKALVEEMLIYLIRIPDIEKKQTQEGSDELNHKMMEVAEYIEENYYKDLTLDFLSNEFYISKSYLSRSFHKETGFFLVEYINLVRVIKAKAELITTNDKIIDISERCGFGSVTHFGRIFRSITELSPRSFRKVNL